MVLQLAHEIACRNGGGSFVASDIVLVYRLGQICLS